ncbi:hypothetical protein BGZ83_011051 [Gryganskiella cystojenkinii]|nr:hypothetical protein BGZ83_011051 [Gryganskiella cystojenkinii]
MYSSSRASSRTSSHTFLDPSGLDFDLPSDQLPTNHITTIPEDDQEDSEADYVHIRGPYAHALAHAERRQDPYYAAPPVAIQDEGQPGPYAGTGGHFYGDNNTPNRSLTSSPALPSSYYSPNQQPPQPRYQYPRTRISGNGSGTAAGGGLGGGGGGAGGGGGGGGGLPLYASRTQRMQRNSFNNNTATALSNGYMNGSSALDQSGKPIFRGPALTQPRISSGGIGGLSSSSDDSDEGDEAYFIGGRRAHAGIHKRISSFRSRRGRPWYKHRQVQIVGAICVLSLIVRLWGIGYPSSVVFDEVHFGGFASKYIRGRFFMDVHPPLAKMLIALVGWVFGLDPSFDFKDIGLDYLGPKVPYVAMRLLCGLMGAAVVPMAFFTIKNSGHSLHASILAAVLVLFENSIVTQSRLILLDSPLIFFTAFTALAWTNFHNQRKYPFSDDWFIWLFLTGVGLGLTGSVKWVGLFTIATIGTSTINQLWILWGDLKVPSRVWLDHFMARAFCLILVPVVIYMFMFEIHFLLLANGGDGDGFMSAPFQMTLGRSLQDSPLSVAYGATVTIRHQGTQGGYLHSHPTNYETGSKQQQITLYPHKDTNNDWIIQKKDGTTPSSLEYVKNGDVIRLLHVPTFKRLHSHDHKAPVTEVENHFEVSGYGEKDFAGDANDEWRVEIVDFDGRDKKAGELMHTLRSKFKLVHQNMACDLFSHSVKLPKWGFEQQEVTCMRSAVLAKTTWMIESNAYDAYPVNAPRVNYKVPGFFGKFIELNKVMWKTNAGLTDSHPYDSRPSSWPWLRRGISFWGKDQKHVYLIGNWFTWYLSSFSVALYAFIRILLVVRDKRGYRDNFRGLRDYYELSGGFFFMAWAFHYLPFFLMDRQLFLHHYLPALYFSILLLCVTFDLLCRFIPNRYRLAALLVVSFVAIYVFRTRAPLTYGSEWTRSECEASKMLKTWDYDCWQFPVSYDQYRPAVVPKSVEDLTGRIIDPPVVQQQQQQKQEQPHNGNPDDKPHDFLEHLLPHNPVPLKDSSVQEKKENEEAAADQQQSKGEIKQAKLIERIQHQDQEKQENEKPLHDNHKISVEKKVAPAVADDEHKQPPEVKGAEEPAIELGIQEAQAQVNAAMVNRNSNSDNNNNSIPDEQELDVGDFKGAVVEDETGGEDPVMAEPEGDVIVNLKSEDEEDPKAGDDVELGADDQQS